MALNGSMSAYGYLPFCLRSIFKIQEKHGFNFVAQQHIKDLADKLSHTLSLVARKPPVSELSCASTVAALQHN